MFRKHYKNAFDKIETNHNLIDEIFENAEKKQKTNVYTFAKRYGMVAAVLVLMLVGAQFYPQISKEPAEDFSYTSGSEDISGEAASVRTTAIEDKELTATAESASLQRELNMDESKTAPQKEFFMFDDFKEADKKELDVVYNFLENKFGKTDSETGNTYSFGIVGKTNYESNNFYLGRWSHLVDDHSSLLCDFILSEDMWQMYRVTFEGDKIIPIYESPLF